MNVRGNTDQIQPPTNLNEITPLLILGIPRSGTTLVQSLLDGHPDLLVDVYDCRFFRHFLSAFRHKCFEERITLAEKKLIGYVFGPNSLYYQEFLSHISIAELKYIFRETVQDSEQGPKDFIEAYMYALGIASGTLHTETKYWVNKLLGDEFSSRYIRHWWPEARFIFVVRDPRDVFSSYKQRARKNKRPVPSVASFAAAWARSINTMRSYQTLIGNDKCLLIQYETLIEQFDETVSRLTHFLNIDKHPLLFMPSKGHGNTNWRGNAASYQPTHGISNAAVEKWKVVLNRSEVLRIESLLNHEMEWAGYDLSEEVVSVLSFPVVWLEKVLREVKYYIHSRYIWFLLPPG